MSNEESRDARKCWYCIDGLLIWGGDHDCEDGEHLIRTNLTCEKCGTFYEMWWGKKDG